MNLGTIFALSAAMGFEDAEDDDAFAGYGHEQDKLACHALALAASTLRNAVTPVPDEPGTFGIYTVGHRLALVLDDVRALDIDGRRALAEILAGIGIVVVGDFIAQGGLR